MKPGVKFLIEMGPLLAFFIGNWKGGIFWGTGAFMVATIIALIASWILTHKLAKVPLISAIFVGIFGGLTLWLQDVTFIKIKVTLINALLGCLLLGGLYFGRNFLKSFMGESFPMTNHAWRILTWRWGFFFLGMAVLNEIVWRTQSDDIWIDFKVFGIISLTMVFALAQTPLMTKHAIEEKPSADEKR